MFYVFQHFSIVWKQNSQKSKPHNKTTNSQFVMGPFFSVWHSCQVFESTPITNYLWSTSRIALRIPNHLNSNLIQNYCGFDHFDSIMTIALIAHCHLTIFLIVLSEVCRCLNLAIKELKKRLILRNEKKHLKKNLPSNCFDIFLR